MKKPAIWAVLPDIHFPEHSKKAMSAVFCFLRRNPVDGVVLLGDNLNCDQISHHTAGLPGLRRPGGYKEDLDGFDREILKPLERRLKPGCRKVFILGNHEDWVQDLLDAQPELAGAVGIAENLRLRARGWTVVPCGGHFMVGRVALLHGDQIGSGVNVARKLVDSLCTTAVMGHVHTLSCATKTSTIKERSKWTGWTLPCLSSLAPGYTKGRPNAWLNGFGILETWGDGYVNIYPVVIVGGRFSFGGVLYG